MSVSRFVVPALLALVLAVFAAVPVVGPRPSTAVAGEPHPVPGCPGDVDGNRFVNSSDLLGVALHFGIQGLPGNYDPHYDMDGNTAVNSNDLLFVATRFGLCPFTTQLSDLPTTGTPSNGFGPFERDRSNGEDGAGDGGPLTINGVTYPKGLGVHAASELRFTMPGNCTTFAARVGIDDEVGPDGSVGFEVWNNTTTRLYQSPVKTGADAATAVSVPIGGVTTLRLLVTTNGSDAFDHADWGDAKVTCTSNDFTAPTITNVSPASGTTSAVITWNTNEIANSQVEFGAKDAYGSTTQLSTMFTTAHSRTINGLAPGTTYHFRVLSRDPAGNLGMSADGTFATGASSGLFGDPVPYAAGPNAHGVFIADLNGDADNDVVTANAAGDSITVLLGNGDGTFDAPVAYATADQPKSVTLGLINNDAFLDAVTANQGGSGSVSVLLGNGDGTFDPKTDVDACAGSHEATLALLNADAFLDIACAGWGASFLGVLLGNGSGGFAPMVSYATGVAPHSIVAGLFNNDAFLDLATANNGSGNVSLLLGNGNGTFGAKTDFAAGSGPHSIRTADLNGDTELDLVTANNTSNNASVLLGNGDGTFDAAVNYATGQTPKGVAIADINGNGTLDILTANIRNNYPILVNPGGDSVSVLPGNGNGTFAARTDYVVGQGSFAVAAGLLNGDTKLDIATANWWDNGITVRLNTGP